MSRAVYGGQAVIEGVVIRGVRTLALACRLPTGEIYRYREPLRSILQRSRVAKLPFVRGIFVLWESLSHGMRMLMRSADLQLPPGEKPPGKGTNTLVMTISFAIAIGVFIGIPYVATQLLERAIESDVWLNIAEGALRLALLVGYIAVIGRIPEIRRVFAYHGAEHMTIHAFEHGDPLDTAHVTPYPTAHPRCGTAFLLFVAFVAVASFAFIARTNVIVDLVIRLALVIPVASVSYELLKLGASYERRPLMRVLVAPGLLLQRLTTRRPDEGMIEVAIASLEEALAGDSATAADHAAAPA